MIVVKIFIAISAVLLIAEAQYQQYSAYTQPRRTIPKYPLKQRVFPNRNPDRSSSYGRDERYQSEEKRVKENDRRYDDDSEENIGRNVKNNFDALRKYVDSVISRKMKNRFPSFDRDFGNILFLIVLNNLISVNK
jgi:hypothetical protein